MAKLRSTSIMKFLGRHKNKKELLIDGNTSDYNVQEHLMFDPPSADDRKFLQHASEEAVAAWNSTHSALAYAQHPPPSRYSAHLVSLLPPELLERVFAFVCPHTQDETYETCERSAAEATTCALCDTRDLARCAITSKRWRASAIKVLYHSIRIDPVHYCDREIYLSERRRKTRFDRNGIPEDAPTARLGLLARTLREDPTRLGQLVQYLKLPYMLRESNQSDLARTLAVLPHLRYVDLPAGLFSDEHSYTTLRLEVEVRCKDLRKMQYFGGSERSFGNLALGKTWQMLEVLELQKMNVDPVVIRQVLGVLTNLRALKVTDTRSFTDDVFGSSAMLPPFPPLEEFVLVNVPNVTTTGLIEYLSNAHIQASLKVLTLTNTGVQPATLRSVLANAYALQTFAISTQVETAPSIAETALPMSHQFLEVLRYEITASEKAGPFSHAASSHYSYLASSILSGGFPRLRAVYVRDPTFDEQLQGLIPPPALGGCAGQRASASVSLGMPPTANNSLAITGSPGQIRQSYAGGMATNNNPFSRQSPLTRTLEVFSKDEDSSDWRFISVQPPPQRTGGHGHGHSRSLSTPRTSFRSPNKATSRSPDKLMATSPMFDTLIPVPGRSQRPVSSYGLDADVTGLGWGTAGARHSVMVGNGAGGFLAVPANDGASDMPGGRRGSAASTSAIDEWPRPRSSAGDKGSMDLWR